MQPETNVGGTFGGHGMGGGDTPAYYTCTFACWDELGSSSILFYHLQLTQVRHWFTAGAFTFVIPVTLICEDSSGFAHKFCWFRALSPCWDFLLL